MTKAEILKKEILQQYRSVRQFAMEMNIPYSTLVTALERGKIFLGIRSDGGCLLRRGVLQPQKHKAGISSPLIQSTDLGA